MLRNGWRALVRLSGLALAAVAPLAIGQGSTFVVKLPLAGPADDQNRSDGAETSPASPQPVCQ